MGFVFTGDRRNEISFPLGGIGTGCVGLAGDGRLLDWEIFNRPNKCSMNGFTHFALKAESGGRLLDARVLQGDLKAPYTGDLAGPRFNSFGFGPQRYSLAGVPHFRTTEFTGEYPFARVRFLDDSYPGEAALEAFNPFIPLDEDASSIPAAFFELRVRNTTDRDVTYTACFSLADPNVAGIPRHEITRDGACTILGFHADGLEAEDVRRGDICVATDARTVSWQKYWFRGRWFDNLGIFWRDFTAPGALKDRSYERRCETGILDAGSLAASLSLSPGEEGAVRFVLSWSYPNCCNYWNPAATRPEMGGKDGKPAVWRNHYSTVYADSRASARRCLADWDALRARTLRFKDALFSSTLPPEVIDAVAANVSILKSPTCMRLTDGSFYAFEGCHEREGSCEGSCTHVWNYAYALPFLFPRLERSMHDLDYQYNQREDGRMSFRLQLPVGAPRGEFRACADGQLGGVVMAYREWKISGDDAWLRKHWPRIKRTIEYAWAPTNEDKWDPRKAGVLTGRQHHTLDMELFGPNSWLSGFYLAALKAGAEMADHLGDAAAAREYRAIFARGKARVETELWNGAYYQQTIDLKDKSILEPYLQPGDVSLNGDDVVTAYWDAEHGEIKYQIGGGCEVDQVIAQWHANLSGLGDVFDLQKRRAALRAIYQNNFKKSMRGYFNACRVFCLNDEAGVVICDWPTGTYKPFAPIPYAEETMHGYEYQVASHMIQEGMVQEGLEIVRAVRERYDGFKRNPWNEIECGSNYARSMASYALLLSLSGFSFDMSRGRLGFNPVQKGPFRCLWSLGAAWGNVRIQGNRFELEVVEGSLGLRFLDLPFLASCASSCRASVMGGARGGDLALSYGEGAFDFGATVQVIAGETLVVASR